MRKPISIVLVLILVGVLDARAIQLTNAWWSGTPIAPTLHLRFDEPTDSGSVFFSDWLAYYGQAELGFDSSYDISSFWFHPDGSSTPLTDGPSMLYVSSGVPPAGFSADIPFTVSDGMPGQIGDFPGPSVAPPSDNEPARRAAMFLVMP